MANKNLPSGSVFRKWVPGFLFPGINFKRIQVKTFKTRELDRIRIQFFSQVDRVIISTSNCKEEKSIVYHALLYKRNNHVESTWI